MTDTIPTPPTDQPRARRETDGTTSAAKAKLYLAGAGLLVAITMPTVSLVQSCAARGTASEAKQEATTARAAAGTATAVAANARAVANTADTQLDRVYEPVKEKSETTADAVAELRKEVAELRAICAPRARRRRPAVPTAELVKPLPPTPEAAAAAPPQPGGQ